MSPKKGMYSADVSMCRGSILCHRDWSWLHKLLHTATLCI